MSEPPHYVFDDEGDHGVPSPSEMKQRAMSKRSHELLAFRKKVLRALEERYTGEAAVWVDVGGVDSMVYEAVAKEFRDRGWTVEFHSDQRDGSSMSFR